MENAYPKCQKCLKGELIPLSDYGPAGSSLMYKVWVCTNIEHCGVVIRIDKGEVRLDKIRSDVKF